MSRNSRAAGPSRSLFRSPAGLLASAAQVDLTPSAGFRLRRLVRALPPGASQSAQMAEFALSPSVRSAIASDSAGIPLSRFFGIVIAMHYNDHVPLHFHARYGSDRATLCIRDMTVLEGHLLVQVISPLWPHDKTLAAFTAVAKSALPKL
jgi:hypothetical protein